jgi:hypothetical protein
VRAPCAKSAKAPRQLSGSRTESSAATACDFARCALRAFRSAFRQHVTIGVGNPLCDSRRAPQGQTFLISRPNERGKLPIPRHAQQALKRKRWQSIRKHRREFFKGGESLS